MTWIGHIVVGATLLIPLNEVAKELNIYNHFNTLSAGLFLAFYFVGTLFPDIDEPNSYIGKKFGFISKVFSIFVSHRGITHTLLFTLIPAIFGYYFLQNTLLSGSLFGFSFGMIAHLVGDMLTKSGIKGFWFPFYPSKRVVLLPYFLRFVTNSKTEYFVILLILCVDAWYVYKELN